ncbi:MAG: hypothetical protein NC235_07605 [Clostridiales bacterium]|nr:hypothetical protein [Clostridiales bacterium]
MDSIVIRQYVAGIKNGKTLDVTGYNHSVIKAGHVVIYDTVNDVYKPMPVNEEGTAYEALPASHEYAGVVVATVLTRRPMVGIMYAGEVNDVASPYPVESILSALKTALPTLVFKHD